MIDPSGTEVVFEELRRSHTEIMNSRRFPAQFRRHFDEYLYKSHQLTEAMRHEYKAVTGMAWVASDFTGWNAYTAAIKSIRNAVVHGTPLVLHEAILAVYPAVVFATDSKVLNPRQASASVRLVKSTCFVDRPFQEEIVTSCVGYPSAAGGYTFPVKEFVCYEIPQCILDAGAQAAIDKAMTRDVLRLVLSSYPVFRQYYTYYQSKLQENKQAPVYP